jgi:hypothetical protein
MAFIKLNNRFQVSTGLLENPPDTAAPIRELTSFAGKIR